MRKLIFIILLVPSVTSGDWTEGTITGSVIENTKRSAVSLNSHARPLSEDPSFQRLGRSIERKKNDYYRSQRHINDCHRVGGVCGSY